MYEFAARGLVSSISPLLLFMVRGASSIVPLYVLVHQNLRSAITLALFLGCADGSARLRFSRTARSLVAKSSGLVIASALGSSRIAWANVLGVETWQRVNDVNHVAIHYRGERGGAVATCWEQFTRSELVRFVTACAARVNAKSERTTITLVALSERGVWLPILQRIAQDVAVAACIALVLKPALLLGALTTSVSAVVACSSYFPTTRTFVLKDGVWWLETKRGPRRLKLIPPSLRMWVDALNGYRPRT